MDSGNNKRHSFRSPAFFPNGVRTHTVSITGVHGVKQVKVGIGVAKFRTKCTDGSVKEWLFPGSILNTESPVNFLCSDRFHYNRNETDTGHEWIPKSETLRLDDGRIVKIERDSHTKLPLLEVETVSDRQIDAEEQSEISAIDAWVSVLDRMEGENDSDKQLFQHTHLQPHTTDSVRKLLGSPNERRFNETIKHGMIKGTREQDVPSSS